MVKLQNQQGCLIGYTIGNSIGNGYIKLKRTNLLQLKTISMKENSKYNLQKGEITDDIKLCISIIRKLLKSKIIYNENDFLEIYSNWSKDCYNFNNAFLKILISLTNSDQKLTLDDNKKKAVYINYPLENNIFFIRVVPIVFWLVSSNYNLNFLKELIINNCKLSNPNNYCTEAAYIFGLFLLSSLSSSSSL